MALYFITGNAGKFREIQALVPDIQQLDLDLDEIQSLDPQAVIAHKLEQAAKIHPGELIVEDGSVVFECLDSLPGPFIKWFEKSLGLNGIAELVLGHDNHHATASVIIGHRNETGENHFFKGEVAGTIVMPRGDNGFGWDPIFVPDGHTQTFAEMNNEAKNSLSMRHIAATKLQAFIKSTN